MKLHIYLANKSVSTKYLISVHTYFSDGTNVGIFPKLLEYENTYCMYNLCIYFPTVLKTIQHSLETCQIQSSGSSLAVEKISVYHNLFFGKQLCVYFCPLRCLQMISHTSTAQPYDKVIPAPP